MKQIYKITNKINGKSYIGQSYDFAKRFSQHMKDSKRVNDHRGNTPLYSEAREIGWENFKIELLEECENEISNERESFWIKKNNSVENGYNKSYYAITAHDPKFQKERIPDLKKATDKMKRKVSQYTLEGDLIANFSGVREAGRETGISHQTIQKVANGNKYRKTAGGFIWKYS